MHLAPQPTDRSGIAAYAERYRRAVGAQADVGIEALDAPGAAPTTVRHVRGYVAAALGAAPRFDVVHAELGGSGLRELYAARAVARRTRVPLVLTVHDPPWLTWQPFHVAAVGGGRPTRALVAVAGRGPARRMQRGLARRADALLALSALGAAALRRTLGVDAGTLPYPCDPATAAAGSGDAAADGTGLTVGFHGYWYGGKGIDVLLAAVALTRDDDAPIRLRLWGGPPAGGGSPADRRQRAAVGAAAARLEIADRVALPGPLADADVPACLAACDVVALPYEERRSTAGLASISSVAYDALAAGTPVVASRVRALPEIVRDGVDGLLVPPADPRALAAALRALRDDPVRRRALRAGARERASLLGLGATGRAARDVYAGVLRPARP
nr:glycosyltransferase [Patulibacter sp. SYSU D01012]